MKKSLSLGIVLLCLSAGSAWTQASDLKSIPDLWVRAYESGDVNGLCRLYADDAVLTDASGERAEGLWAIEMSLGKAIAQSKTRKLTLRDTKLRELGDIAIQNDTWEVAAVSPDDKTSKMSGQSTVVYQRTPKGWLIVNHHTSAKPSQ